MVLKRGYFFSLDALIAVILLFAALLILPSLYLHKQQQESLHYFSQDIIEVFSNLKVGEVNNSYIQTLITNGTITNLNNTILEQVGEFWALGELDTAENMITEMTSSLIPQGYNVDIALGGDVVPAKSEEGATNLVSAKRLISGLKEGESVVGYATRVFLTGISGQGSSSYTFFGGYVGDGIITQRFELPEIESVEDAYLETNIGNSFDIYINDNLCERFNKTSYDPLIADKWYLDSSCLTLDYFQSGINEVKFVFVDNFSEFIGGGLFKVKYKSSELNLTFYSPTTVKKEWLPGIQGLINIFSSFYTPGDLNDLEFHLHFLSNYTIYLNVGNVTVFESAGSSAEQEITVGNLSSTLNFGFLSQKTIPIRLGTRNITLLEGKGGIADIALITDRTGSMDSCDVQSSSCLHPDCNWNAGCQNRRKDVAVDSDKLFINTIFSVQGNNLGLVGYGEREAPVCSFHDMSQDNSSLQNHVDDYNYGGVWQDCGYTCISCGVVGATKMLMENQALYNLTQVSSINTAEYQVGDGGSGVYVNETLNITIDKSKFVKGRITIFARNVDTDQGFRDCVYLNDHYLGRACISNEVDSTGWHTCSYPLKIEWLNDGGNKISITGGNTQGCYGTSGTNDDWYFKDVKLTVWQLNQENPSSVSDYSSGTYYINGLYTNKLYSIYLPELAADEPNPVDFTSGMNSTANTYGAGQGDDGWDWSALQGSCTFNHVVGGRLQVYKAGSNDGECSYGIQFYIDNNAYSKITLGSSAMLSFDYEWDGNDDPFENADQVWIKGNWTSPTSGNHLLGSNLDGGVDNYNEIDTKNNPDTDFTGSYTADVSSWIEGPGWYYLEVSGKLDRDSTDEWGYFYFDNFNLAVITPETIKLNTNIGSDFSKIKSAQLKFEALDVNPSYYDCMYINDEYLGRINYQEWSGVNEWQEVLFDVPTHYLRNGENILITTGGTTKGCNRTGTNDQWNLRNINLSVVTSVESMSYDRTKSMLVMSDGEANTKIGDCHDYGSYSCPTVSGALTPSQETIQKACKAHELYNISIYTIAFGNAGSQSIATLNQSACCDDCSHFYTSNNADELAEIYARIANDMLIITFPTQQVNITGEVLESTLYPDSYIKYNYTSSLPYSSFGSIPLTVESARFGNNISNGSFEVNPGMSVLEAKVTSYSADSWTDYLSINNQIIYNLSDYGSDYITLGDPFVINIPTDRILEGINNVTVKTGITPYNSTGGSIDDRVVYTLGVNLNVGYSGVKGVAAGCEWFLEFEDGTNETMKIPSNYSGSNRCVYDCPAAGYSPGSASEDAINSAVEQLLRQLDFDCDGKLDINFDATDLGLELITLPGVPFLWGPTIVEVRTWQ